MGHSPGRGREGIVKIRPWILFLLIALAAGCERRPDYPERTPPEGFLETPENQAAGKVLFLDNCASCHGTVEEGLNPRIADYYPHVSSFRDPEYAQRDPAYLYWRIATGKQEEPYLSRGSIMPAWGPYFSEETIWQLVAYLRARPVKEARKE